MAASLLAHTQLKTSLSQRVPLFEPNEKAWCIMEYVQMDEQLVTDILPGSLDIFPLPQRRPFGHTLIITTRLVNRKDPQDSHVQIPESWLLWGR